MNILVVYCSTTHWKKVNDLRDNLSQLSPNVTIMRLEHCDGWRHKARSIIKQADVIVYCASNDSLSNNNIDWELKTARKFGRRVICLPLELGISREQMNPCLNTINELTKKTELVADWVDDIDALKTLILKYATDNFVELYNNTGDMKALVEQYRLFSQTAENLLTRRQNVNSFYITANTALVSIGATIFSLSGEINSKLLIIFFLTIPGILLNLSWGRMLRSYFINNKAKIKILSLMELHLPFSTYDAEWRIMKNKYNREKYISFTDSEKQLPRVFIAFYCIVDIIVVIALVYLVVKINTQLPQTS